MKRLNDKRLENILLYIKNFSLDRGRSPSFREIQSKFNLSSLSMVSRYVDKLCASGSIKKTQLGEIDLGFSFKKSETIIAPIVGSVKCGQPGFAQENYEGLCTLPTEIFGKEKSFLLRAEGDSMEGVGIREGDLLVVRKSDYAKSGDIVVALIDDSATVKTFKKMESYCILHPENPHYQDIIVKDVKILGIVKQYIHNL